MTRDRMDEPAYLNAYLNGMQFVLLALEGRLSDLEDPSPAEIRDAMHEYHEMAHRMRQRSRLGVDP